ncbi:MAG: GNAT family N-acetyltransferase [Clostridia bacterium]|nr:GNAT family N-acetyltransferase [Clostridia bacterium]
MKKLSLTEYLKSPCSAASLPYWKQKNLILPDSIKIVHDQVFVAENFKNYRDEKYFRLFHDLKEIGQAEHDGVTLVTATPDLVECFVTIINASYTDLSVTREQLEGYRRTPVYHSDLWVLLKDDATGNFVGGGIADYDREIGELILEWIQVLPQYRGRGYGQMIVNHLLRKMQGKAKFATVSGKADNPTNPERLYRKCGFRGNDLWHILSEKQECGQ